MGLSLSLFLRVCGWYVLKQSEKKIVFFFFFFFPFFLEGRPWAPHRAGGMLSTTSKKQQQVLLFFFFFFYSSVPALMGCVSVHTWASSSSSCCTFCIERERRTFCHVSNSHLRLTDLFAPGHRIRWYERVELPHLVSDFVNSRWKWLEEEEEEEGMRFSIRRCRVFVVRGSH